MSEPDPRLRLRVFVDGYMAAEVWIDSSDPDARQVMTAVQHQHQVIVQAAHIAGLPWMLEVYDPELPEGCAYLRVGTDTRGMVVPLRTITLP